MWHVNQALAGLALAATSLAAHATVGGDPRLREDLDRIGRMRVLFGHQSVGAGIVAGMQRLVARSGADLRIAELRTATGLAPGLTHAYVERNGDPRQKLASFDRLLSQLAAAPPDVAFVKFCYVDFDAATDTEALFRDYQATLAELARRYPHTRFIHVTAPIQSLQGGLKAAIKRLLGRAPGGFLENARREAFNARLRATYAGPALFDLARLEAVTASGVLTTVTWRGQTVPSLPAENTIDGGHLSAPAEERIARVLAAHLATLPVPGEP